MYNYTWKWRETQHCPLLVFHKKNEIDSSHDKNSNNYDHRIYFLSFNNSFFYYKVSFKKTNNHLLSNYSQTSWLMTLCVRSAYLSVHKSKWQLSTILYTNLNTLLIVWKTIGFPNWKLCKYKITLIWSF